MKPSPRPTMTRYSSPIKLSPSWQGTKLCTTRIICAAVSRGRAILKAVYCFQFLLRSPFRAVSVRDLIESFTVIMYSFYDIGYHNSVWDICTKTKMSSYSAAVNTNSWVTRAAASRYTDIDKMARKDKKKILYCPTVLIRGCTSWCNYNYSIFNNI